MVMHAPKICFPGVFILFYQYLPNAILIYSNVRYHNVLPQCVNIILVAVYLSVCSGMQAVVRSRMRIVR